MRWIAILLITVSSVTAFTVLKNGINKCQAKNIPPPTGHRVTDNGKAILARLHTFTGEAKTFTLKNNFNSRYCFLVDMKMASGQKRFFIYDLEKDTIIQAGLVTHGNGNGRVTDSIVFSNIPGSNCTSPGKYKIGSAYYGRFGLAYKLHGLDKTNNNAYNRFVVLHAHPCVPDQEVGSSGICKSLGCPTVSPLFLNQLKMFIDRSGKPILLWIFT